MNLDERIKRYEAIEAYRKRPLIAYATSTRHGVNAMVAGDAVREFIDQLDAIPADTKAVDVLLHSTGGDALAAWKLMSLLRERFETVAVLVPYMAFSAATIFALGADEIVMHPHSSLGPIDPQIVMTLPDGSRRTFAFEDVGAFLRFLSTEVGLTEQVHVAGVVDRLFKAVDPVNVGAAKRASELATAIGERLLQMHMTTVDEKAQARSIAEMLNKKFFAHADAVSRTRAKELHLKVAPSDPKLESLVWDAYCGIESYLELRRPFVPLEHYLANGGGAAIQPVGPLAIPSNTPPQLVAQIWQGAAQNALQSVGTAVEVDYSILFAVIESPRVGSENRTEGKLSGARIGAEVQLSAVETSSGWFKTR
jgi:hypothetical protein